MKTNPLLVLVVDRQQAKMFVLNDRKIDKYLELTPDEVPQKVKHGDDTWDAQDKIFRHIEDHLHRHLAHVALVASQFAQQEKVTDLLIGSHRPLFGNIEKHLKHLFPNEVLGKFVISYKAPKGEILKKALKTLDQIEIESEEDKLQHALL